jgi:hypothetical protein
LSPRRRTSRFGSASSPWSTAARAPQFVAFEQPLRELASTAGQDLTIDFTVPLILAQADEVIE